MTRLLPFDEILKMATEDPDGFEVYRQKIINAFINNLPVEKHEQTRRLQWRIDQSTRHIKNPMVKLEVVYGQMMDSFLELGGYLQNGVKPRVNTKPGDVIEVDFSNKK